ncbi:hypothetical protein MTO98_06400 [Mucilaginibacter sp. SMC90]|uniref:hypothetical protein n=1 Tax=Mucilaginibacter sp. SMC90 TaxID=2929803 RepID=UPI001FB56AD1|nr:hypothetical protein [Mucilaginibacter sp. SMC90]UOE50704.1 hypothetical protein MTO98_06400 [Mucilaginibacter sp. SMC90]
MTQGKNSKSIQSSLSLMIMVAFLVLGYCPLRNVLCSLANHSPQNKEQKAPRDVKAIIEECNAYNSGDKVIPYQEVVSKTTVPLLMAIVVEAVPFAGIGLSKKVVALSPYIAVRGLSAVPIYLANKALLI